jgi:hypothetical protein
LNDTAQLLRIGLEHARKERRDGHRAYTVEDAFNLMDEFGFVPTAAIIYQALAAVISYKRGGDAEVNPPPA